MTLMARSASIVSPLTPIEQDTGNRGLRKGHAASRPPTIHLATWPDSRLADLSGASPTTWRARARGSQAYAVAAMGATGEQQGCIRTVLAEGQPTVRDALRGLVTHGLGMQVVGEARTLQTLQRQVQAHRPDLAIVDWDLWPSPHPCSRACAPVRRDCASSSSGCVRRCEPPPWRPAPTGS